MGVYCFVWLILNLVWFPNGTFFIFLTHLAFTASTTFFLIGAALSVVQWLQVRAIITDTVEVPFSRVRLEIFPNNCAKTWHVWEKLLKTNYGLFAQNHSISSKCHSRSSPSTRKDAVLSYNFISEIPPLVLRRWGSGNKCLVLF